MLHNAGYYVTFIRAAHRRLDLAWEQLVTTQEDERGRASALNPDSGTLQAPGPSTDPLSLKPQFPDLLYGRQSLTTEAEIACTCPAWPQAWAAGGGGGWLLEGQTERLETEDRRLWNLDPQSLCHLHRCSLSQVLPELSWVASGRSFSPVKPTPSLVSIAVHLPPSVLFVPLLK